MQELPIIKRKTIMQELIEIMNKDQVSFTEWFLDNYEMLLEKEKEQIKVAYSIGFLVSKDLDMYKPAIEIAEDYYVNLYN